MTAAKEFMVRRARGAAGRGLKLVHKLPITYPPGRLLQPHGEICCVYPQNVDRKAASLLRGSSADAHCSLNTTSGMTDPAVRGGKVPAGRRALNGQVDVKTSPARCHVVETAASPH